MTVLRNARTRALALVIVGGLLMAACGGSSDDASTSDGGGTSGGASLLGEKNPASGTPVKIGTIGDGQTAALDNRSMVQVAEGMVEYLNEYRGGIGGHPIELVSCETEGTPAKTTDCANQMIKEEVVLTILPPIATTADAWTALHDAGVPTFLFSAQAEEIQKDTETTFTIGNAMNTLIGIPSDLAKDNDLDKVVAVVIDVPAATQTYKDTTEFDGVSFDLVAVPPGTADMSPQMSKIAKDDDVAVQIVGNDTFAISAMQGLTAAGFDGPISCIGCDTEAARKALGNTLDGVVIAAQGRTNPGDEDAALWDEIAATYVPSVSNPDELVPVSTYIVWAAAADGLDGITGDITQDNIVKTLKGMPSTHLRMYGGIEFRCNGKADPEFPAACADAAVYATLDEEGNPGEITFPNAGTPIPD